MSKVKPEAPEKKDKFTVSQRKVIDSRAVNLLVSAGAGSGKTTVMIERIVDLLKKGASLERMAICTFTNASAADMRTKLTEKLLKEIAALEEKAAQLPAAQIGSVRSLCTRLERQMALLPTAQIGTIHSLCMKLVRRAFYLCNLDPSFTVIDDAEANALKDECAEALLVKAFESGEERFMRLYDAFASVRSHAALKKMLLAAVDYARAQPKPEAWLMREPQKEDAAYRKEVLAELDRKISEFYDNTLRPLREEVKNAGYPKDRPAIDTMVSCVLAREAYTDSLPKLIKQPEYKALHNRFGKARKEYIKLYEKWDEAKNAPSHEKAVELCATLGTLAVQLIEAYGAAKKARRKIDYADLEHYALQVLTSEEGAALTKEYDFVFVDEYQDVNPLQEEILNRFHGGMFYVGDVKQSIYGFRMCTPEFFVQKRNAYGNEEGEITQGHKLKDNFRSGKAVLAFVNKVFLRLMTEQFGGTNYKDEAMERGSPYDSSVSKILVKRQKQKRELAPTEIYSVEKAKEDAERLELLAEVTAVVREIERFMTMEVPDEEAIEKQRKAEAAEREKTAEAAEQEKKIPMRAAKHGDIAVLVRSSGTFLELLVRVLRERGIPAHFVASEEEADTFVAVNDLLAFLHLLDNAEDDISLVAALLSHTYGKFTEPELARVRLYGDGQFCTRFYAYAESGEDATLRNKAAAFTAKLERFRARAAVLDVATLAGEITAEHDSFTEALRAGGERESTALDAFIEQLSSLTEHNTLHDYLVFLKKVGVPQLSVAPAGDAVRIMTMHKAKGLEFPFVILPNLEKKFNLSDSTGNMVLDKDEGIVLCTCDPEEKTIKKSPRFLQCANRVRDLNLNEALRILYVAMTRAKYHLSLVSLYGGDESGGEDGEENGEDSRSFFDFLRADMDLPETDEDESDTDEDGNGTDEVEPVADEEDANDTDDTEPQTPVESEADRAARERLTQALTEAFRAPAAEPKGVVKTSVSSVARQGEEAEAPLEDEENEDAKWKVPVLFAEDRAATERGTAYHLFMEHVRFGASGEWDRLVKRYPTEGALIKRDEIERAFTAVADFIAGRPYHREQSFVYRPNAAAEAADYELVQGVIDLLIEEDDGFVIVDYKTGSPQKEHLDVYRRQLDLYAKAVEEILERPVRATYLYWFKTAEFMKTERPKDA